MGISAVILTKNEIKHIADCIRSVQWTDEVVLLDSLSTDGTVEIARQMGAVVYELKFVNYAQMRDEGLARAKYEWVLFVDADERVTPELAEEIREVTENSPYDGYWIPRHNIIWGKRIGHAGWYPDHQLRLMRRDRARYDPQREVHELAILDGEAGYLKEHFVHYNYDTVRQFLKKQNRYTDFEAQILFKQGTRVKWRNFILQPLREFKRRYISLAGYKDGAHGLLLCLLMAYYNFIMYTRLRRLWTSSRA